MITLKHDYLNDIFSLWKIKTKEYMLLKDYKNFWENTHALAFSNHGQIKGKIPW